MCTDAVPLGFSTCLEWLLICGINLTANLMGVLMQGIFVWSFSLALQITLRFVYKYGDSPPLW